jgi:tRNA A37 N6-isopentenylltransferase MiaA
MPKETRNTSKPPLLVIFGPTSSGKTKLSLELAESLAHESGMGIEVVGADSRQVYAGMNIGTSKVGRDIMQKIPHHCLDMRPPDRMVTLAEYQALAHQRIQEVHGRGNLPVMVGGTGSYVLSVTENWNVGELLLDGEQNYKARGKSDPLYTVAFVRPTTPITSIMTRIDKTVVAMCSKGLVEEVVSLSEKYKLWEPKRLQTNALWHTHGYREFLELAHTYKPVRLQPSPRDLPKIISAIQEHTRAYAQRQWSWLKKLPPVTPTAGGKEVLDVVKELLTHV